MSFKFLKEAAPAFSFFFLFRHNTEMFNWTIWRIKNSLRVIGGFYALMRMRGTDNRQKHPFLQKKKKKLSVLAV